MELVNKITVLSVLGNFFQRGYPFVIISYPDLIEDYLQRHISYYDMTDETDRQFEEGENNLPELCRELSVSNIYLMQSPTDSPKPPEYRPKWGSTVLEARPRTAFEVDILGERKVVNLFPCQLEINQQFWFIAYGFNGADVHYLFVQESSSSEPISFEALIERSAEVDRSLTHNVNYLEKTFINTMNHRSRWKSWTMAGDNGPLCSLNRNQLFRVCSSVYEAIKAGNDSILRVSIIFEEHYSAHPASHNCLLNQNVDVEELRKFPAKYPKSYIRVNLVPCSINEYSFHLTHDPVEENAVFVLEKNLQQRSWTWAGAETGSQVSTPLEFKVISRVRKVSALKFATKIF